MSAALGSRCQGLVLLSLQFSLAPHTGKLSGQLPQEFTLQKAEIAWLLSWIMNSPRSALLENMWLLTIAERWHQCLCLIQSCLDVSRSFSSSQYFYSYNKQSLNTCFIPEALQYQRCFSSFRTISPSGPGSQPKTLAEASSNYIPYMSLSPNYNYQLQCINVPLSIN